MKLLKVLFILILLLFPFGELLRFDLGNTVVIKPLDVIVGLTGVWFLIFLIQRNQKSKIKNLINNKLASSLLLFIVIGIFSLLINFNWLKLHEFFVSSLYLLRWVAYASLFFIVSSFDERFKNIIKKLLVIDGLLIVAAGFIQYFLYNNLRNLYYLGWDEHLYRLFSTFLDPNFAGAFFVLYFIFVGGILYHRIQKKNYRLFLFFVGILVTTLVALLLTFSRSALIMFCVSVIVSLVLLNQKRFIVILLGFLSIFFISISPWFYLENINPFRTASSEGRIETAQNALTIFADHPFFGVGFNSYRYAQTRYGFREEQTQFPSHADAGVDNSFLFILATTGIVGFGVYIFLWYSIIASRLVVARSKNIIAVIVVSSVAGLFVNALFINSLFFALLMFWMWVILGLSQE